MQCNASPRPSRDGVQEVAELPAVLPVLAALQRGEQAWEAFLAQEQAYLGRCAMRAGAAGIVEDAVQESLLAIHGAIGGCAWRDELAARAWLKCIVSNAARRLRGREAARAARERRYAIQRAAEHGDEPTRSNAVVDPGVLAEALAHLPSQQRRIIAARFIEGRPIAEVAAQLGVTTAAVKMACQRALGSLRRRLPRSVLVWHTADATGQLATDT